MLLYTAHIVCCCVCDTGAHPQPKAVLEHSVEELLKTYCWAYAEQKTQGSTSLVCFLAVQHGMTRLPHACLAYACTLWSLYFDNIALMWDLSLCGQFKHGFCVCAGASAAISLLQSDATLVKSALHDLADKAIVNVVKPDLALLSVLLDKGLFEKVAGGLQAQLIKVLSSDPQPPSLEPYTSISSSAVPCDDIHAESILLPATVSLLTAQGYYAQAAALCMYQTHAHPAFANFESGLQQLLPYLTSFQENSRSSNVTLADVSASWPLPQTLVRLHESMHARLSAALERMKADNYDTCI
jgi:hypothetical protein